MVGSKGSDPLLLVINGSKIKMTKISVVEIILTYDFGVQKKMFHCVISELWPMHF